MRRSILAALPVALVACGGGGNPDINSVPPDLAPPFMTAAHAAWPMFSTADGVDLAPLTLVSIVAQNDPIGAKFLDFGDRLVASQWWTTVGAGYGLGAAKRNVRVTGPAIPSKISESQLVAYIDALVAGGAAPAPDGNTVYFVYLPDGVTETAGGTVNTDCNDWEGYHLPYHDRTDNWGFAQRCFHDTQDGVDDATNTASHEVIEAATDPTGNGWTLPPPTAQPWTGDVLDTAGYGVATETADACVGTAAYEGSFQYQRVWSNAAAAAGGDPCVPATSEPYYNVAPARGWTEVAAGATVAIPLTGWTTAPMGDFYLELAEIDSTGGTWTETLAATRSYLDQGTSYPSVNNGDVATLTVRPPANAPSGAYLEVMLFSTAESVTATSDLYHAYPVGAYVP